MTIEERVDRLEASWGKTDPLVRELRDAVTVTAELERQQGKQVLAHARWLEEHDASIKEHKEWMREHKESMKDLDKRIGDLVSGIGAFIAAQKKD